jgi:hypothetical protein
MHIYREKGALMKAVHHLFALFTVK